jgi:protoporphyrin/coproporphyrin ferrochelatase
MTALAVQGTKSGVLLLNIGSPEKPTRSSVARYLRKFLGDGRVIDMHPVARWLLVNLIIVPFRAGKSAKRYASIWTPEGSPLIRHSLAQATALQEKLPGIPVFAGMRYSEPLLEAVLERLLRDGVNELVVVPMYPQYASASTGSALDGVFQYFAKRSYVPSVRVVGAFYEQPAWLDSVAAGIEKTCTEMKADHLLFSYHGLPLNQLQDTTRPTGGACGTNGCCDRITGANHGCYRAQCLATSAALTLRLPKLPSSTSFQSRLKGRQWIEPYTDVVLVELAKKGVKRLAVACPSFVADCLETIEEIGVEARDIFRAAGGEELRLVPCVNDDPPFIAALAQLVRKELDR